MIFTGRNPYKHNTYENCDYMRTTRQTHAARSHTHTHTVINRLSLLCGWGNMGYSYCTAWPKACKEAPRFQPHHSQRSRRRCWGRGNPIHVSPSLRPHCRYPHSTAVTSSYDSRWRGPPNPAAGPPLVVKRGVILFPASITAYPPGF
jgi:hypothetical protein